MKTLLVVTAFVALSACCLYAQTFGEVTGRVTDPSGAVIPGASVTLTNVNTNAVRNVLTTEAGAYTFPSIAPGFYRLRTELPGFKAAAREPFEVQVQQVVRLDITLELGSLARRSKLPLPLTCCNPKLQASARWSKTRSSPSCR